MIRKTFSLFLLLSLTIFMVSCDITSTTSKNPENTNNNTTVNDNKEKPKGESSSNTNEESKELPTEDRNVRLFYNDVATNTYVYVDTTVKVTDKAMVKALVAGLQKPLGEKYSPVLSNEIGVRVAKLDKVNDTLTVDFSDNFIRIQNLGAGPEIDMLQSLTNTLGYNLGVNNVVITLMGSPYESGHVSKGIDEPFKVNYSNYKEYKN